MSERGYSFMYWLSLAMAIFGSFVGTYVIATIWLAIAAMYLIGGDILKELRKNGTSNNS